MGSAFSAAFLALESPRRALSDTLRPRLPDLASLAGLVSLTGFGSGAASLDSTRSMPLGSVWDRMTMGLCLGGFFLESCGAPPFEGGCPRDVSELLEALELSVKDRCGSVGRFLFDLDRNKFHFLDFCWPA